MNEPGFYKLKNGDVFTMSFPAFAAAQEIWNNPAFTILGFKHVRLRHHFLFCGFRVLFPYIRKTWLVTIKYDAPGSVAKVIDNMECTWPDWKIELANAELITSTHGKKLRTKAEREDDKNGV